MKYKIWDKVRYLQNTPGSDAIIWGEYYITKTKDWESHYSLWSKKWVYEMSMWVKENDIELVEEEKQPIYIVYVDWMWTPRKEYTDIEKAKTEAKRLIEKERKKSFVFELKAEYEIDIKEFNY